jgi:hypothetical protein
MNNDVENMQELKALQFFMSQAKSVKHWNELREKAKEKYEEEIISMLDASGFISKILPI